MKHILKCPACKSYALQEACPCGNKRIPTLPPKFSPEDKYGEYRRRAKKMQ
ncbi:MAG: nucleolar RNA-binding Nop10p family protein [archaeon]